MFASLRQRPSGSATHRTSRRQTVVSSPLRLIVILTGWVAAVPGVTPSPVAAQSATADRATINLFDGQTLDGWEGSAKWFRVQDGCIVAGSATEGIPHNHFLCTRESFADFELTYDAKLTGQGDNAGVQFRSRRIKDSSEVQGYQADIGTAWNRSVWGALYDESRRDKILAEPTAEVAARAAKLNDWNAFRIRCVGPRIQIFVNGEQTVDYTEPDDSIDREGIIGLQIHSGPPTQAWYRNLKLRRLEPDHATDDQATDDKGATP